MPPSLLAKASLCVRARPRLPEGSPLSPAGKHRGARLPRHLPAWSSAAQQRALLLRGSTSGLFRVPPAPSLAFRWGDPSPALRVGSSVGRPPLSLSEPSLHLVPPPTLIALILVGRGGKAGDVSAEWAGPGQGRAERGSLALHGSFPPAGSSSRPSGLAAPRPGGEKTGTEVTRRASPRRAQGRFLPGSGN